MSSDIFYPEENKKWKWVLQWHSRGKSVHGDLRIQIDSKRLQGWTLNWILSVDEEPENYSQAETLIRKKLNQGVKLLLDPNRKTVCEKKALEPMEWLTIDKASFPSGTIGATKNKKGFMGIVDHGTVEFGTQKAHFHEYFLKGKIFNGRLVLRLLPNVWRQQSIGEGAESKTGKGYTVWMGFFSDPKPYVLTSRALKKPWYPPEKISALPKDVRTQIPSEYHYWKILDQKKAHEVRDDLIRGIGKKEIVLRYSERDQYTDIFARTRKAKKTSGKIGDIPIMVPQDAPLVVDKVKTPSQLVKDKIAETLFYDPPKNLKFWWKISSPKAADADCLWLAAHSPYSIDSLPMYPEQKLFEEGQRVAEKCKAKLEVEFPDGKHYEILPAKDEKLYQSVWVEDFLCKRLTDSVDADSIPSATSLWKIELEKNKDLIKSLIADVENMPKVDKAFMVWAGQPLIKDVEIAIYQAAKEVYNSMGVTKVEEIFVKPEKYTDSEIIAQIQSVAIRLLNEGQVLAVEEQLGFWKNLLLELQTTQLIKPVTKALYAGLVVGVKKMKDFTKVPVIGRIIKSAVTQANLSRTASLERRIKLARSSQTSKFAKLTVAGLTGEKWIINELDYFISFWKDSVLIFASGTSMRNIMDNTLKSMNEMLNSACKGEFLWPFLSGKGIKIIKIPEVVRSNTFARSAAEYKTMKEIAHALGDVSWWETLRSTLYEALLSGPEGWARAGFYAGKITKWEKDLLKAGKNPEEFAKILEAKGIREVNRVFFDYSKKMAAEIPLSRIFPFFQYNARNFNYWLKDFMVYPWKLGAIRGVLDWWDRHASGIGKDSVLKDKIPLYLVRGTFFNPMSWLSAYKFIEVFAKRYRGDPKWLTSQKDHIAGLQEILKEFPPDAVSRIFTKTDCKNLQDFIERQKCTWSKTAINVIDRWFGLLPHWRKILELLEVAETQEWKKMTPQGQLVDAIRPHILHQYFGKDLPKPSQQELSHIYKIMEAQGVPTDDEIELYMTERKLKWDEAEKTIRQEKAKEIVAAWKLKQTAIGYFTGMYLTRSYKDIYQLHKAIFEELESKE